MKTLFCLKNLAVISLLFCLSLTPQRIYGAPAYPYPVDFEQPDGSVITIQLHGDEWVNWRTTEDDYTMLFNSDGFLEYAIQDEYGGLKPSGIRARNERYRTSEEREFLRRTPRNLRFSGAQQDMLRQVRGIYEALEEDDEIFQVSGERRVPVILVDFPDRPFHAGARASFQALLDQESGYNVAGRPGSLREYFRDASHGRLNLRVDVIGPITLPQTIWYYDHNNQANPSRSGAGGRMARDAIQRAVQSPDWRGYPATPGSSTGIAVHIIFAGYGQEAGAPQGQSIWSHASSATSNIVHNGITYRRYSCSPEYRGRSGTTISGIGIVAHELGHSLLGLPDFYDTNGDTDGRAVDLGRWCLMASGNWAGGGDRPTFLNPYAQMVMGWGTETVINASGSYTLHDPSDARFNNGGQLRQIFRINTPVTTPSGGEYFYIENRQRTSSGRNRWDSDAPGSGMLIYHVDRGVPGWSGNRVNAVAARRGVSIRQAGCATLNGCGTRGNDPFPRSTFNSFTDATTPNSRTWNGNQATNRPITNITSNARVITFDVGGSGGSTVTAPTITTQPANRTVNVGQTAAFTVAASGTATLTYQWQVSTNGGTSWTNATATHGTGFTSTTFTTVATTAAMSGNRYRVTVTNSAGNVTSNGNATLTVNNPTTAPAITTQPANRTVTAGQTAAFTVAASGTAPLTYQWQISTNGGTSWANATAAHGTGITSATFTTAAATMAMNSNRYRVIVTNSAGNVTSNGNATLTVNRIEVARPAAPTPTSFVFNNTPRTLNIPTNANYTISGNTQTNAGNYEAVVTLRNANDMRWAGEVASDNPDLARWAQTSWGTSIDENGSTATVTATGTQANFNLNRATEVGENYTWSQIWCAFNPGDFANVSSIAITYQSNRPINIVLGDPALTNLGTGFAFELPTRTTAGTQTINISDFTQPSWVTTPATNNRANVASIIIAAIDAGVATTGNITRLELIGGGTGSTGGDTDPIRIPWTITRANYDMSGITFANRTVTFNGNPQNINISGTLPSGVSVTYTGNGQTAVGDHTVTANFTTTSANHNAPPSMTATLTILEDVSPSSIRDRQRNDSPYGIILEKAIVSDAANIRLITPEPATANIKILDNLGNVVFTANAVETRHALSLQIDGTAIWNLTNNAGRYVANGTYLIVVEAIGVSGKRFAYSAKIGVNR